jgi:hypothetical protein
LGETSEEILGEKKWPHWLVEWLRFEQFTSQYEYTLLQLYQIAWVIPSNVRIVIVSFVSPCMLYLPTQQQSKGVNSSCLHTSTNNYTIMMKYHKCPNVNSTTARNIYIYNTFAAYATLGRTNIKHLTPSGYCTYQVLTFISSMYCPQSAFICFCMYIGTKSDSAL